MIEFGFKPRIYCRIPTDNKGFWDDEKRKGKSNTKDKQSVNKRIRKEGV